MKTKRFTLFWKKLIVMDLGLIVILVRIFGMILGFLTKKSTNISIFPKQAENGYPFFDSINCDIKGLAPIIDSITIEKEGQNNENKDNIIFNSFINNLQSQQCTFFDKLNICNDNKKCFNELNQVKLGLSNNNISFNYHSSDNEGKLKISNLIKFLQDKNEFINNKNNNSKIEIDPYYKIISGYYSYLNIKLYEQNKNNKNYDILKEIANHEEKINNLLYLHSLFLKAQSKIYKNKISSKEDSIKYIDQCLRESEDQFTYKNSFLYTSENNKQKLIEIIENDLKNLINCIPDFNSRYSYSVDIRAIKIMIKILFGFDENITKSDKKIFNFYLKEISKSIKSIFIADAEIRQKANIYEKYQPYFITIFICISLGALIFINRYFIKNRDYYNQGSRILEKYKRDRYNFMYNNKHHQYWQKMQEMENKKKEEEEMKKKKEDKTTNIEGDKDKCTKEELEYIKKLADENKGDFILSK